MVRCSDEPLALINIGEGQWNLGSCRLNSRPESLHYQQHWRCWRESYQSIINQYRVCVLENQAKPSKQPMQWGWQH